MTPAACAPLWWLDHDVVGLLGKLTGVSARLEPLLTKRRAVDLCRTAGCCCCCSC
ncbi:Ms5788A family Cys-rich leader peptide [Mycobacterium marinum]|uniref:Ms5788A family Cys-rich leader peptide n=1 Tax=Mycobacterium marinum TaxID=1781 RepID=UPI0038BCC710